jgi:hypothetical protein
MPHVAQSAIRHFGVREAQFLKLRHELEVRQCVVMNRVAAQVKRAKLT